MTHKVEGRDLILFNGWEVESKYSLFAQKCGIKMSEMRLFERELFTGIHTVNAAGLMPITALQALIMGLYYSYVMCLQGILKRFTHLFRQIVFNVTIMNRNNHAKNFLFHLINGEW